jgi:hypothetical protein
MQIFVRPHYTTQRHRVTRAQRVTGSSKIQTRPSLDTVNLIITLISGAVGSNAVGAALEEQSLGTLGNSIAGILGGGIGAVLLQIMGVGMDSAAADLGALGGQVFAGGVGGGFLMVLIALIRRAVAKT